MRGGRAVMKKRRRLREKERIKKANGNEGPVGKAVNGNAGGKMGKKEKKEDVVRQLGKGGVKVIDKKGELRDVDGKTVQGTSGRAGGGNFKL